MRGAFQGPSALKSFKSQCGKAALHALNVQEFVVYIASDVFALRHIDLHQQVIVATGGVELRMELAFTNFVCHVVGGAGFALNLNKHTGHGASLRH